MISGVRRIHHTQLCYVSCHLTTKTSSSPLETTNITEFHATPPQSWTVDVAGQNIVFLQNERHDINDWLSIYGGTFWTNIPLSKHGAIEGYMNDYSYIPNFTPKDATDMHLNTVANLEKELQDRRWIVMSHHKPSFDLIDDKYKTHENTDMNYAFASDIAIAKDDRIVAWVYGHTHTPRQIGKFYCNPFGYPGKRSANPSPE